jgi:hypothetical protein
MSALTLGVWLALSIPAALVVAQVMGHHRRSPLPPSIDLAPVFNDDPVSVASARLFGLGVDRRERLVALRFLGALMTRADPEGRLPLATGELTLLGRDHKLGPEDVGRSLLWLELVSVLERREGAWLIADFEPLGSAPPPAAAMEVIARVMARPAPPAVDHRAEPNLVMHARRPAWGGLAVGAVAVAAALLVALWPSGGSGGSHVISTAGSGRTTSSSSGQSSSTAAAGPGTSASAPTGTAGSTAVAHQPVVCPTGGPVVVVAPIVAAAPSLPNLGNALRGTIPLGGALPTTVSGTLRNDSSYPLVVDPFPVVVHPTGPAGIPLPDATFPATRQPVTLQPGQSIPWSTSIGLPSALAGAVRVTASARVTGWHWADPALAAACPH